MGAHRQGWQYIESLLNVLVQRRISLCGEESFRLKKLENTEHASAFYANYIMNRGRNMIGSLTLTQTAWLGGQL